MKNIFEFKETKYKYSYIFLLIVTTFDFLIFKEKYLSTQLIEFGCWLWFFLKSKVESIFVVKTAAIFLAVSAVFYLFKGIVLSEHFLNVGIIFILVAVIVGFIEQVRNEKK